MNKNLYPYGFIYETRCLVNNMKYRGSHKRYQNPEDPDDSWYIGSSTNPQFWEDLDEYGLENFERIILEEVTDPSKDYLKERECFYLKQVDAMHNPEYYNRSNSAWYGGGATEGMKIMHKEDIEKFFKIEDIESAILEGWELGSSNLHRSSNSESQKGKIIPQKTRDKISETLSTGINPMNSEENRRKVSESKSGRIWINNGVEMKQIYPNEFEIYSSYGYIKGMIKTKHIVPKDYDCNCKVCGKFYKGGKYSVMCSECYSDMRREEMLNRYGGKI